MGRTQMLSMIMPAYNESQAIVGSIQQLQLVLGKLPVMSEIVVVDDGSTDDTAAKIESVPGVRLIKNPVNLGYGHSLLRGIQASKGDLLGIMDADLTYPPELIPDLFVMAEKGADLAIGRRTGKHLRSWFSMRTVYRWLCGYVCGEHVPDANSGLRLFRREVVEDLRGDLCLGFSFTTSLTLSCILSGYVVTWTDIPYERRVGQSHVRTKDIFRTLQYLFQLIAVYNPLKLFLPFVLLNVLLAVGVGAYGAYLNHGVAILGALVLFSSALVLVGLSATSYIVSRTGLQTGRNRLRRDLSEEAVLTGEEAVAAGHES
jgi:glycosyltransferase involved in cell wall biosynthesis